MGVSVGEERQRDEPASLDDMLAELADIPLLSTLDPASLASGLERSRLLNCPSGVAVIEQGEYDDRFFVLVRGRCEVWIEQERQTGGALEDLVGGPPSLSSAQLVAQAERVARLSPGDFFGELACMSPWPRASTVRTTGEALLLEVDAEVFEEWRDASESFRTTMDEAYMSRGVTSLLRRVPAFSELDEELLAALRAGAVLRTQAPGDVIVREGEVGKSFFLIRGGSVVVTKRVGDEARTVSYLSSGKYFGEMALLAGSHRNATVTAVTATELVCIERDVFTSTLARSPAASAALERAMRRRERGTEAVLASESISRALAFVTEQGALGSSDELLVVDLERCTYCGDCEVACETAFGTSRILLHGPAHDGLMFPTACRNCTDPLCTLRCPVEAIARDARGEVRIEPHCIGCGQCALHCPYGTISMAPLSESDGESAGQRAGLKRALTRRAVKCDLCQPGGGPPRCVRSCPTAALRAMDAEAVLRSFLGKR